LFANPRPYPIELLKLEAIVRRLPPHHPRKSDYEKKLHQKQAGYKGEKILDYHLAQINHPDYTILRDLRIPYNNTHFQIDALILSPHYFLVTDSKYYAGTLIFLPEFNELKRIYNDAQEIFSDPILQTKIQASQLQGFLDKHHFTRPPVEYLAAITNPQAIIQNPTNSKLISERVCRPASIAFKLPLFEKKHQTIIFSKMEIKKITKLLIKYNEPLVPQYSNLPLEEMVTGVQCTACSRFGMRRMHGSWVCNSCGSLSKDAHLALIRDYFHIHGSSITNQQFRRFAKIDSPLLAKRLLAASHLIKAGSRKTTSYSPGTNFDWGISP
jgi:hypothetical protein